MYSTKWHYNGCNRVFAYNSHILNNHLCELKFTTICVGHFNCSMPLLTWTARARSSLLVALVSFNLILKLQDASLLSTSQSVFTGVLFIGYHNQHNRYILTELCPYQAEQHRVSYIKHHNNRTVHCFSVRNANEISSFIPLWVPVHFPLQRIPCPVSLLLPRAHHPLRPTALGSAVCGELRRGVWSPFITACGSSWKAWKCILGKVTPLPL